MIPLFSDIRIVGHGPPSKEAINRHWAESASIPACRRAEHAAAVAAGIDCGDLIALFLRRAIGGMSFVDA